MSEPTDAGQDSGQASPVPEQPEAVTAPVSPAEPEAAPEVTPETEATPDAATQSSEETPIDETPTSETAQPETELVAAPVKPTVGRIVHYVAFDGTILAAIVIAVPHDDYAVSLALFSNMPNVADNTNFALSFMSEVMGDFTQNQPGTWHWPPRV